TQPAGRHLLRPLAQRGPPPQDRGGEAARQGRRAGRGPRSAPRLERDQHPRELQSGRPGTVRDSGGRGQGPGRGGAGPQGGPGAVRRTPGGSGRSGRTGRSSSSYDPFHLHFGEDGRSQDDSGERGSRQGKRSRDQSDRSGAASPEGDRPATGRSRGEEKDPGKARKPSRPRTRQDESPRRTESDAAPSRSRSRTESDAGPSRSRSRAAGDAAPSRGRTAQGSRPRAEGDARASQGSRSRSEGDAGPSRGGASQRARAEAVAGSPRGGAPQGNRARAEGDAGPSRGRDEGRQEDAFRRRPSDAARRPSQDRVRGDARGRDDRARRSQADGPVRRTRGEGPGAGGRGGTRAGEGARRGPQDGPRPRAGGGGRKPPPPRPPMVLRLGNPRRRISIGLIGMTFILSIFAGRLIQMQGLDSKVYEAAATKQRLHVEEIPAKRGAITDVNGHNLAHTVEARDISIDPSKIPAEVRQPVASLLARHLGKPVEEMAAKLAKSDSRYQLLARGVAPPVADRLLKEPIPSLHAKSTFRRVYPGGDLAGSLIGFVGDDKDGLTGIEQ